MIYIAHRGLLNGPDVNLENRPEQIQLALDSGFHAEVDVWLIDGQLYLGHDVPDYKIDLRFLRQLSIVAHAKTLETLVFLLDNSVHCFWHQEDTFTLTSAQWIWAFPHAPVFEKQTVCVMPELYKTPPDLNQYFAVCTDYVFKYQAGNL